MSESLRTKATDEIEEFSLPFSLLSSYLIDYNLFDYETFEDLECVLFDGISCEKVLAEGI